MYILLLITAVMVGIGLYNTLAGVTEIPSSKTSKLMVLSFKQRGEPKEKLIDVYITKVASFFERVVHLNDVTKDKIQIALRVSEENISPEIYLIKAFLKAFIILLAGIPFLFLIPLVFLVFIGLAVMIWLQSYYSALDFAKKRKKLIETELPRFVSSIAQNLQNSRDVLSILMSYRKVAGQHLGLELDTTIAEMRTGNYEQALIHFESRIGSSLLSDITRGLIGTLRGDDQSIYFKMLAFDMRQIEYNLLRKEAEKRPRQIQKYSMFMLICIIIIYGVVLATEIVTSLGVIF